MSRILVADDEEGLRELLAEILEGDGHEVVTAADGEAAWRELVAQGFDVLLTDLKMPGMDGLELLRRAREAQPELQVIMMTAHGSVDSAVEAMKAGAFEYLQKPVSGPAEIRLLVRRALDQRALADYRDRASREAEALPTLSWGAPAMVPVLEALGKVAPTRASVLLTGESGTGKEVAARWLHARSDRAAGPFVAVNGAALSAELLESELFGHEKGAFTGASERRRGRLELADGGTFFLDEVGELAPGLQAKLLRVLQERCFERVGGRQTLTVDVRFVAATNQDLTRRIEEGAFREDLYHRLAVFPIRLPPLRERVEDILPLAESLLAQVGREVGRPDLRLDRDATARLQAAPWTGNVRELRNVLERAAILADGPVLGAAQVWLDPTTTSHAAAPAGGGALRSLEELEREAIQQALLSHQGNRRQAAESLGIGLRTLYDKLKRYRLGHED